MLQEAAQKLLVSQRHYPAPVVMGVVLPTECHVCVVQVDDPVVGDRHSMGVASQILQHMFQPAKRRLGVDHPILATQRAQETSERLVVRQRKARSLKGQLVPAKGALQTGDELTPEYAAEHLDRQEEMGSRRNPPGVIWGQPAAGHDTVDVRVRLEGLAPGMQDAEAPGCCAEVLGVGSYFE